MFWRDMICHYLLLYFLELGYELWLGLPEGDSENVNVFVRVLVKRLFDDDSSREGNRWPGGGLMAWEGTAKVKMESNLKAFY